MAAANFRFRQTEVARMIRALDQAGKQVEEITIDNDGQVKLTIKQEREEEAVTA